MTSLEGENLISDHHNALTKGVGDHIPNEEIVYPHHFSLLH